MRSVARELTERENSQSGQREPLGAPVLGFSSVDEREFIIYRYLRPLARHDLPLTHPGTGRQDNESLKLKVILLLALLYQGREFRDLYEPISRVAFGKLRKGGDWVVVVLLPPEREVERRVKDRSVVVGRRGRQLLELHQFG